MSKAKTLDERKALSHKLLEGHLSKRGLRRTKQRETVLEAFLDADAHVSVDELCESLKARNPEIGPATVYRCMNLFVKAGVAKERRFNEGRVRFEPAVASEHHDHLICTGCGGIQEFEDDRIESLQEEIARSMGFRVDNHRMELYGTCRACLALETGKKPRRS